MKKLIKKAEVLVEALPYLQEFRKKTVVIKLGGSTMENPKLVEEILKDAVFMENVGMRIIIIHGGGKAISSALKKEKIEPKFIGGLRVSDKETMKVVEKVLVTEVNAGLVKIVRELGGKAVGFSAADHGVLFVKKKYGTEEVTKTVKGKKKIVNKKVDIGFVGEITNIHTHPIYRLLNAEQIPIIAPLGLGENGFVHNINADTAACELAARLKAEKLVFVTDVDGILENKKLITSIKTAEIKKLISKKVITDGMIPKSLSMVKAIKNGVGKTHIINGNIKHSLLLEIFTTEGIGTEILK